VDPLQAEIQQLLADWAQQSEDSLARVWQESDTGIHVEVVTTRQGKALREFLPADASVSIHILSSPEELPPHGFFELRGPDASLYTTSSLKKLTTDFDKDDGVMRGLARKNGRILVQLWDGTLGWIQEEQLSSVGSEPGWTALKNHDFALSDQARPQTVIAGILKRARSYIGLPYVLGGRSTKRMDCSGLTSRVMRDEVGFVLPRHSTDQRRCGERVTQAQMGSGDLLFARLGKTNVPHVGFVVRESGYETTVIHASQRANAVIEEPLDAFFKGYRFMGVRRFIPPGK